MKDKKYWAIYYGVDETLPDKEFYHRVREINRECNEKVKKIVEQSAIYKYKGRETLNRT